ncbi:MAG: holo-ACP synthase [Candidatus Izemoplasma sp.]
MSEQVGIDIVEFSRIKKMLSDAFINRILSLKELSYLNKITNEKRKLEYIASRFAAKEAYTKVYKRFESPLNFKDVSILKDKYGAPYIETPYRSEDTILISISHSENYAIAICIKK